MLFNSFEFFVFFPTVVLLYFLMPHKWRWLLLLSASYYFYMWWKVEYAILIIISTLVDFYASKRMAEISDQEKRKPWLWLSLVTNLGILGTFKYYGFFSENVDVLLDSLGFTYALPVSDLLLPMGISFYTFQTMAYSIDIYYGRIKPEKHLGYFALYVTYFPQLVAGPIERAQHLLPQFRKKAEFDYPRVVQGLKQMCWGFFKKLVIADRLSSIVGTAFGNSAEYDGLAMAFAAVGFAVQVYGDFSGYSDIAIGAARVLGVDLTINFKTPFASRSISEFWTRWHITLYRWFIDYIYIPLGGNRVAKWRWYFNIMMVFFVSGIWHGDDWHFIVYGLLNGAYILVSMLCKGFNERLRSALRLGRVPVLAKWGDIAITFALTCFAFIYFRSATVTQAHEIMGSIFTYMPSRASIGETVHLAMDGQHLITSILAILFMLSDTRIDAAVKGDRPFKPMVSMLLFATLIACIVLFGFFGEVDFFYFQF